MKEVWSFLESSTIHGLVYISTTSKSFAKLFWILVVIAGFTGAGIIIYLSFQDWANNPVTTTIKTMPITEITFPNVTVCPPKNTFTNLNYDLIMLENMTFTNETRDELTHVAVRLIHDHHFQNVMHNLSQVEDVENNYYNWYHGYTNIGLPFWGRDSSCNGTLCDQVGLRFRIETTATSGTFSTQYFGEKFDAEKVNRDFINKIIIYPPQKMYNNETITLHLEIDKNPIQGFEFPGGMLNDERNSYKEDLKPPRTTYFKLNRIIPDADIENLEMTLMPGYRIKWHYNEDLVPDPYYFSHNSYFRRFSMKFEKHVFKPFYYSRFANILFESGLQENKLWYYIKQKTVDSKIYYIDTDFDCVKSNEDVLFKTDEMSRHFKYFKDKIYHEFYSLGIKSNSDPKFLGKF